MSTDTRSAATSGAGVLGLGAAACVACCAKPILGALSAIGIASAAGFLVAGSTALVLGIAAAALVAYRRRRRRGACATPSDTVTFVAGPGVQAARSDRATVTDADRGAGAAS